MVILKELFKKGLHYFFSYLSFIQVEKKMLEGGMMMKRIAWVLVLAFLALQIFPGGLVVVSASGSDSIIPVVTGSNNFAVDLYKKITSTRQNENVFFSPMDISMAMGMTFAGARGNTEKQMAAVMHFSLVQADLHAAFSQLSQKLKIADPKEYQLNIANALWGQKKYPFTADFLKLIKSQYDGGFQAVDFAAATEESRRTINSWVEKQTDEKIKDLLQQGDVTARTRLVLTNAIYFKGDWVKPFKNTATWDATFNVRPAEILSVPSMHQEGVFGYKAAEGVQVLEMPYAGRDLSMFVLLPQGNLHELDMKLSPEELERLLSGMEEREVKIALPKFKFEARYRLGNLLSEMGMPDAFDERHADFSGMTGAKDLFISAIIHQAVIDVNENGSEAAAATAVTIALTGIRVMPDVVEFKVDRPFLFLIRHKPTGTILFMGRVTNPAAN